ncbi:MAG: GNAT family N-acetyltransferase [Phycisphaerales bacterium]|nr:MAG: GNAT family N-acetyltransferase [Phycisphaerales bacterium]
MGIQIRQATDDDLEGIVESNIALARESEDKVLRRATVMAGVRAGLEDPKRSTYFVAEMGEEVVGQTMVTTEWSDWRNGWFWWIQSVYVHPAHRGRGVFRALYRHIRSLARSHGDVCGLRLYVESHNSPAISTYVRLGMKASGHLLYEEDWPDRTNDRNSQVDR